MFDLYVVTDSGLSKGRTDAEVARLAYEGGADAVSEQPRRPPAYGCCLVYFTMIFRAEFPPRRI